MSSLPLNPNQSGVIAVDPGPAMSACVIWDNATVVERMTFPNTGLCDWATNRAPSLPMAVEMVACYGMPVGAETFDTCLFIGRLQEIWSAKRLPFRLVYRREIKIHFCGSMRAKDANIRQALLDKFGPVGTKKNPGKLYGISNHLWSALAVAVYVQETEKP